LTNTVISVIGGVLMTTCDLYNGGVRIAYRAFERFLAAKSLSEAEKLQMEQKFFLGWAQIWCENETPNQYVSGHLPILIHPDVFASMVRSPTYRSFSERSGAEQRLGCNGATAVVSGDHLTVSS
jgi:hypothetical protein